MAIEGIDGLFLGAGDFTITNGQYGLPNKTNTPWDQPSTWETCEIIAKAALREKKIWGNLTNPTISNQYKEILQTAQFLVVNDLSTAQKMAEEYQ